MKNKQKTKKKTGQKKEIKRPAHKKPRPKKHVEARIPDLPPVPTETIPITKETPEVAKTVTVELPDGQTETTLTDVVLSAAKQLRQSIEKEKAELAEKFKEEQEKFLRLCGTRLYKDPGVGLIHRHNFENEDTRRFKYTKNESGGWSVEEVKDSTYVKMLAEEKEASREENERVQANVQAEYKRRAELWKKQNNKSWLEKLFSWFK